MHRYLSLILVFLYFASCKREDNIEPLLPDNPEIPLHIPAGFPPLNAAVKENKPTQYGVKLGRKLFHEKRFSGNNTISCASCHQQDRAFADNNVQAIGIEDRVGLRNTPPIQNLAFLKYYNWDGNIWNLEKQVLVPIITPEEMNSSIVQVINKLKDDPLYRELFKKAFGDEDITPERIYKSIVQYEYSLISANSKYDKVKRNEGAQFTESEKRGYHLFQSKCEGCHSTELFTDQTFRNIGFPLNPSMEEAGRGRVTGIPSDYMKFRVPSLRNVEFTAPYGSFGQFATLKTVLDYLDAGVLYAENLDPILKENGNRIPMAEEEKEDIISFLKTLSDPEFVGKTPGSS